MKNNPTTWAITTQQIIKTINHKPIINGDMSEWEEVKRKVRRKYAKIGYQNLRSTSQYPEKEIEAILKLSKEDHKQLVEDKHKTYKAKSPAKFASCVHDEQRIKIKPKRYTVWLSLDDSKANRANRVRSLLRTLV